ncbi:MAG TPA: phycobiliprotein lyase [Cyanobacteria bacterium UBA11149]|nr:phycobiliprotein lyase [Cyanobacteria bacterium UBA11367]HBE58313.1 phycobiliprotein lyase [Cyanobacteria bacterium UBA11366]HBK62102.1 phycobiliprotein lyase [Cyanobacteria bacterium UBA11166]HBR76644.1 phycobiliprotein lyase [Cyanobacteria bacterium UBA11159]HBS68873.1 phycobiliprotein lyase [Cyanobacteria bacterium UBA11153]HBW92408.1 phycobiliprotein lyase [Cyanobacteria bacterium UBA11149]HCA94841.1 phycobiliprotein lyase [Cyanobacteria bacterium UBA9226]
MDIKEFFEQSAGKWFSQRTSHHKEFRQADNGKSTMVMETLAPENPEVIKLCQEYHIDPQLALCGTTITWDSTIVWDKTQQQQRGATLLVLIPDSDKPNEGSLLRSQGYGKKTSVVSRYSLGSDDVLTLIADDETMSSEDRIWFASPNLRMRTSILKNGDGFTQASLYSEIRLGAAPQPKKVEDTFSATRFYSQSSNG